VIILTAAGTGTPAWVQGEGIVCPLCAQTQVYPTRSGCYYVETTNEFGCKAFDEICLEIKNEFSVYLPNSFTPNGDGTNDVFYLYAEGISNHVLEIFDRWGQQVFSSNDIHVGWDGKFRDEPCKADIYTYRLSYTGLNKKKYQESGHVTLLR
jgi:gliding motility-associated-like protein